MSYQHIKLDKNEHVARLTLDNPDERNAMTLDMGREVEAAARYRSVLVIEPEHLGALNNYADLLVQAGCRDEARALITRAVEIGSDNPRLRSIIESTAEQIARMPGGKNGRCQQ